MASTRAASCVRAACLGLATLLACCCLAQASAAQAGEATAGAAKASVPPPRPRIALVLSGGGARGFAHVGVLRALEELRVPIDLVAGVSMGAVVGGAYAAGLSVARMEHFVRHTAWADIVADRLPRDDLAFRRREEDLVLPSRVEFGVGAGGLTLPLSVAGNGALEATLLRLLPPGTADQSVAKLALPFRSVASDLLTGELVELAHTPLFQAIRSSLAVPGIFAPVTIDGRLVVDGGLVRNLPVDVARGMGADIVIAVNVGTPLAGESELGSALGVAQQMLNILTEQNVQRSLRELTGRDMLIAPDLTDISFLAFDRGERAMAAGYAAAQRIAPRLRALALSAEDYAAHDGARLLGAGPGRGERAAGSLVVRPSEHTGRAALATMMGLREGQAITEGEARGAAAVLLGRGEFERVEISVRGPESGIDAGATRAGRREVVVAPVEAAWARSRLRLGLEVISDFADDNRFILGASHTLAWANGWGAEWRTLARIGSQRLVSMQFLQPLAPGSPWFVAPGVQYSASSIDVYRQGRRAQRLGYAYSTATLALGRVLSNWGAAQLAVQRRAGRAQSLIPEEDEASEARVRETVTHAQVQIDTLDSLALPSRGALLTVWLDRVAATSDAASRSTSTVIGLQAFRAGRWDGHYYGEWARAGEGSALLSLGGFLRLSGTPRESLDGRSVLLSRLVMARRIGDMPAGLGGAVRLGYSIEAGRGFEGDETVRLSHMRYAGSAFAVVDTRFGPLFLATGATRGGHRAAYLFLGPFW